MTIGYNRLGSNGRLGNQMFQYAGLRGIAANMKFDWVVPYPENYGDSNYGLFDCFKMTNVKPENFGMVSGNSIATGCFHFNEDFFNNCPDNINLHDYFQSEKYFKHIENEIREDFTFKDDIVESCLEVISELNDPIFIHIRRGDYVNQQQNHPVCPIKYYENALKHFGDCPVLIFSDDIGWAKEQEIFKPDRFMFSEFEMKYEQTSDTNDGRVRSLIPYYDLCMMSLCSGGGIIANSSMSWWGAWLISNPSKVIVYPTPWFGNNYSHYNMEDLIPDGWICENA